jgi:hypothetical protein
MLPFERLVRSTTSEPEPSSSLWTRILRLVPEPRGNVKLFMIITYFLSWLVHLSRLVIYRSWFTTECHFCNQGHWGGSTQVNTNLDRMVKMMNTLKYWIISVLWKFNIICPRAILWSEFTCSFCKLDHFSEQGKTVHINEIPKKNYSQKLLD